MFHFMPKSSATTCGRRSPVGSAVAARRRWRSALVEARAPRSIDSVGHDLAGQVAADQAGAGLRLGDEAGVVEVGRREDPLHRPLLAGQADEGAGVDPFDADDAVRGRGSRRASPPTRWLLARRLSSRTTNPRTQGLPLSASSALTP